MNSKFLLFFIIVFSNFAFAQKKEFHAPDYTLIKKAITDKNSEFYYPHLLERLKANDTLITPNQYRHLYFGQTLQKNYNPYNGRKKTDELKKYYQATVELKEEDLPKAIRTFREGLEENPLDIRAMNYLAYMYHLSGDEATAKKVSENFHGLFGAILSSGDGLNCETAFHVIAVSHEYVLLNMFQLENKSQSFDGTCDYLEFEKGKYKVPGMYFNVSKLQEKNLEILKAK
ncbi:DUF4919 domain-containing protein [Chryseobacterium sp. JUb7]|uniref:DUF4919 domain-containing protein n=1 Tax=Chryseobacterium sp. JUb7 TaxID=2940599 RepID=UPI002167D2C9|nr:DUF4919 domain-containing protein [Chryseobacterium sp. JUb7]MCS3530560.1 hypothetical protein [Chryseobacterium sp. JUb7]